MHLTFASPNIAPVAFQIQHLWYLSRIHLFLSSVAFTVVLGLGIRANKVQIVNESDCIKVKPLGWMEKKEWREIHDIL
jgi:ABC-type Na+ efflux pump permease subunit